VTVPVSVVIPPLGRPALLRQALGSLGRCDPAPAELVIVDQSDDTAVADLVGEASMPGLRSVRSDARSHAVALNEGLVEARHPIVLVVDDDCTVRSDWVGVGYDAMSAVPDGIITGQVLPAGNDPREVPSTVVLDEPRDYTGRILHDVMRGGNMACPRDAVLDIGGFDPQTGPCAHDCDFCYRWLRAGRRLRHVPDFVVWHHGWRSHEQLTAQYVDYYVGMGKVYAKHLRSGDLQMLRFMARNVRGAVRCRLAGVPAWADDRSGVFRGLPRGLWEGWRQSRRARG
jgi:GT2 family glycosyltransferase